VNSLRVRLPHVLTWLEKEKPDILALQETKVTDDIFPLTALHEAGYQVVFSGQKTYNGMAILSKQPLTDIEKHIPHFNPEEKRVIGASLNKLRIWNIYVPNGESVQSQKYEYKLGWLQYLRKHLQDELKQHPQLIVLGDFNIAPEDRDVYDPQAWQGQVLFSEPEKKQLRELINLGLKDCFRLLHQDNKSYTWWDYRVNAFKRNMGLRIDHILASEPLAQHCTQCQIDKTPRSWERPSDHTPIVAEFNL